jgi:opacity protein-like surface antigen
MLASSITMKFAITTTFLLATAPTSASPDSASDRFGLLTFTVGGGISGFTENTLRDTTDAGGSWTARIGMNLTPIVAFEASYIGSVQTIDTLGIDANTLLVGNGAELALRLDGPVGANITPFLFGGAGWRHYSLSNTDTNTSAVEDSDSVYEFPLGVGLSTPIASNILLDVRGELRYVTGSDMVPNFDDDASPTTSAEMHRWGINLTVGVAL